MITIIDCGSDKTSSIGKVLASLSVPSETLLAKDIGGNLNEGVKGIIISGSPVLLTEKPPEPYLDQLAFVNKLQIPVLGICFGHQIIGMLHGSTVFRCKEDRDSRKILFTANGKLNENLPKSCIFRQDHCEAISLPKGFVQTATSDNCEIEAMEHKEKPVFGVQFHPEVSGEHGKNLLDNFCRICLDN